MILPDINFTTHDEFGIKIRQRHTQNGHDTHLVSESLFGAELTLAAQATSLAWAASEAGGTEVLGRGHTTTRPHRPRDTGGEGVGSLDRGAGPGSPQSSLL